jgi:hypothetical protein
LRAVRLLFIEIEIAAPLTPNEREREEEEAEVVEDSLRMGVSSMKYTR